MRSGNYGNLKSREKEDRMHKLIIGLIRQEKLDDVTSALKDAQIPFTYATVKGFCKEVHLYQKDISDRIRIEIISEDKDADEIREIILSNACCGLAGDGCLATVDITEFMNFS